MPLTAATAHETVKGWIASSETTEHLDCCNMFIYDTLLRLFPGHDATELLLLIDKKTTRYDTGDRHPHT